MRAFMTTLCLTAGLLLAVAAQAQAPVTATCKDGTAFSGTSRSGACRGHGGVQAWGEATPAPAAKPAAAPAAPAGAAAAPAATTPAATTPAATTPAAPAAAATSAASKTGPHPAATAAPGGGPGMVWVSAGSKAYHCQGDKWYGTTKKGSYMTEAEAKTKGLHPDHGKACS